MTHAALYSFVRGSALLLAGRGLSLLVNFVSQVIIVRYLSKSSYGSFAYALEIATLVSIIAGMGFQTTVARFAPFYREDEDYPRLFGSIVFMLGSVIGLSAAFIAGFYGFRGVLEGSLFSDPTAFAVMFILIYFVPIQALDRFLEAAAAVFTGARAIFFRKQLVGPLLRLAAVLLVISLSGDERMLAIYFLVASALGVLLYVLLLLGVMRRDGLIRRLGLKPLRIPAGALLRFSIPILISELNIVARSAACLIVLGMLHGSEDVAEFRAVVPLATLIKAVSRNFTLLFIPNAARLRAAGDHDGIAQMIQKAIIWVSVLTFPLFLLCFVLATPVTTLVFGDRYASSGAILAVLSIGYVVQSNLGFCAHILKVFDRLRVLVLVEIMCTLITVGLALWWIPENGAFGAALAITVGTLLQSLVILFAMGRMTGVTAATSQSARLYGWFIAGTLLLWLFHRFLAPNMWFSVSFAVVLAIGMFALNRDLLSLQSNFPELAKIPFLRKLVE